MRRTTARSCLALLLVGFVMPRPSPARAVGSYPTVSPLPVRHKCRHRRSVLCDTFRRLAAPGRYPAPSPAEPGLSSNRALQPIRDPVSLRRFFQLKPVGSLENTPPGEESLNSVLDPLLNPPDRSLRPGSDWMERPVRFRVCWRCCGVPEARRRTRHSGETVWQTRITDGSSSVDWGLLSLRW